MVLSFSFRIQIVLGKIAGSSGCNVNIAFIVVLCSNIKFSAVKFMEFMIITEFLRKPSGLNGFIDSIWNVERIAGSSECNVI